MAIPNPYSTSQNLLSLVLQVYSVANPVNDASVASDDRRAMLTFANEASLISDGPVSKLQVKLQTHLYMSGVLVSYRSTLNVVTRTPNIHHAMAKIRQSGQFSRRSAEDGL